MVRIILDSSEALRIGEYTASVEAVAASTRASVPVVATVPENESFQDRLAAIDLLPAWPATVPGASLALTAQAWRESGSEATDVSFTWTTSDPEVAAVDVTGRVTGRPPGKRRSAPKRRGSAPR